MTIEKLVRNHRVLAAADGREPVMTDVQSALELMMTVKYDVGTKDIVLDKRLIAEDFFILSTGLAGEILQKFINYGVRLAIYGDFTRYTSKPLRDFIYESNQGRNVFFTATKEEAIHMLTTR